MNSFFEVNSLRRVCMVDIMAYIKEIKAQLVDLLRLLSISLGEYLSAYLKLN
jgi:predicted MarR family transcription regulator